MGTHSRFRFGSAGESHGEAILAILEGIPFGLALDVAAIDAELARRQRGFGRSSRQQLEHDRAAVVAGVYHGKSSGAPLVIRVANKDTSIDALPPLHRPRPGHADLAGAIKFGTTDARPVLERASARETVARVAAGAVVRQLLAPLRVACDAFVTRIGDSRSATIDAIAADVDASRARRDASDVGCPDETIAPEMRERITAAGRDGDTLGGEVVAIARGVPAGLGSLMQWDQRLDASIGAAMLSIPSAKGVEIGDAFASSARRGPSAHDSIEPGGAPGRVRRPSNHAGGVEGGMSNGEPIVVRVAFKPLATLRNPLPSVDLRTGGVAPPDPQRSDVCALPAAAVVVEAMLLLVIGAAILDRCDGTTCDDLARSVAAASDARRAALLRSAGIDGGKTP